MSHPPTSPTGNPSINPTINPSSNPPTHRAGGEPTGSSTQRLRIRHDTRFRYDNDVVASYNEARMTPVSDHHQNTLHTRIDIRPAATVFRYKDYWGTEVHAFDLNAEHRELHVVATSLVDTWDVDDEPPSSGWEPLRDQRTVDACVEWLKHTARTEPDEQLITIAGDVVRGDTPDAAARAASAFVHDQIEYVPGVTGVHSSVTDVWAERKGVCQDIAHLTICLLRTAGIPARYVSGYLHPQTEPVAGETVAGQSHAWVEWWDGGWRGYDPTNAISCGARHVVVARGREYADVAPFKGLYSGNASSVLDVTVEITGMSR